MKKFSGIVIFIIIAVLCFALSYYYMKLGGGEKSEIVVASSPALGSLTWYTSTPLVHARRMANAFNARTGWEVKIVRDSTFNVRERIIRELQRGSTEADVLTIADIGTFVELKEQGRLLRYDSPQAKFYPKKYQDPGYWTVFEAISICMAYNKDRLKDPPLSWNDLLAKKWQGRIGLEDINTAGTQYGQYFILRESLGRDFWRKLLSQQKPRIYMRTEELAAALLKGEIDIAAEFSGYTVYEYEKIKGTPIKGIYPPEGVPLILKPTAVVGLTKKPAPAKKFNDFLLSYEGQALMQRLCFSYSVRRDVPDLEGKVPLSAIKALIPKGAAEYAKLRKTYVNEFNQFRQVK
ncbi:ABC transporter substrate-binding protein [Candidatus Margulisiibacteriota bacterium]